MRFCDERTRPSVDLVNRIKVANPQNVIDLGCGPGNSTQILRKRWPDARIVGLDSSAEMIETARSEMPAIEWTLSNIVDSANHRAAFLSMMADSLDWFNTKLQPTSQPISQLSWDQWFISFVLLGLARRWDSGFLKVFQLVLAMKADMNVL
jgi:trans-aconitate methyltransferase